MEDAETARATLERARALAPESPEVRAASGRYRHVIEGDFVAAPLGSGVSSSYVAYVLARIDVLAGDREGAVTRLEAIARRPGYVSRERMRIDRTLAPLRGDPGSRRS